MMNIKKGKKDGSRITIAKQGWKGNIMAEFWGSPNERNIIMKNILVVIWVVISFFSCKTQSYSVKKWLNDPPYNFNGEQLSYVCLEDDEKMKYETLLEQQSFCIVEKEEYIHILRKISSKNYVIAIRAV